MYKRQLQILFRRSGQITTKDARKDQTNFENFLALGFGGRGHDLPKNFTVRCAGTETAMGVSTYKLELVPKTPQARNMFPLITLWINPVSYTHLDVYKRQFRCRWWNGRARSWWRRSCNSNW